MARQQAPEKPKQTKQDDSIMATNDSSIVSKRSVERLYYPEPHFYRYFVKKPLRRSPLINRGYWLRMHAIEHVVQRFLDMPCQKSKVVLNLGCGYDPLAFQWLSKGFSSIQKTKFLDVDFPELIAKKCDVIASTPQLRETLGPLQMSTGPSGISIRSEHYSALGCDLTDLARLDELLADEIDVSRSLLLCTAEVSMTYMNVGAADALIRWAAQYHEIQFCLLEQYLPAGDEHPFAQKMIRHFNNLQTPLRSIQKYPQLTDQQRRFRDAGWSSATARSLWDLWTDDTIVPLHQKTKLNAVEPFDEWEEFVLFASHYFILIASKNWGVHSSPMNCRETCEQKTFSDLSVDTTRSPSSTHSEPIPKINIRRSGALLPITKDILGHYGGYSQTRLGNLDFYGLPGFQIPAKLDFSGIEPRMCHSISPAGHNTFLLVGGRASPARALKDCWILCERPYRVHDLPKGLYRHCAAQVEFTQAGQSQTGVLIYGGKTAEGLIADDWLLWCKIFGWAKLDDTSYGLEPRFGAVMTSISTGIGLLMGGMDDHGTILPETWEWSIVDGEKGLKIMVSRVDTLVELPRISEKQDTHISSHDELLVHSTYNVISRMGSCLLNSPLGLLLIGGVSGQPMARDFDILRLTKVSRDEDGRTIWNYTPLYSQMEGQRPLFVGHTAIVFHGTVVIIGGGAVCFSFGTYWNQVLITLAKTAEERVSLLPLVVDPPQPSSKVPNKQEGQAIANAFTNAPPKVKDARIDSSEEFEQIVRRGDPVIIRGSQLGSCTTDWTLKRLRAKIDVHRDVVVHDTTDPCLDFQRKNFRYVKKPFGQFLDEVERGSRQYLRSIASERPSEKPANFWSDFPELGSDFELPAEFDIVKRNMHSSVFRISGPVTMWLHYDVMANVLCQIRGSKRLLLYPPSDISFFVIPPGTSSSSINCFDPDPSDIPSLRSAHPQEALLQPGDMLFIPALWLHTASPINELSISVNVFFRNLAAGYALGRDVYGNRDMQAYEKGRKDVEKIVKSFKKLPSEMGRFYLDRLADEMKAEAQNYGS